MLHYCMTFQRKTSRKWKSDSPRDPLWLEVVEYQRRKACGAQGSGEGKYSKDEVQMYEAMCDFRWNAFLMRGRGWWRSRVWRNEKSIHPSLIRTNACATIWKHLKRQETCMLWMFGKYIPAEYCSDSQSFLHITKLDLCVQNTVDRKSMHKKSQASTSLP